MTPHKQAKAKARTRQLKRRKAANSRMDAKAAGVKQWIIKNSAGGKTPCVHVESHEDADAVYRYGLDKVADMPCPICSDYGQENILYIDRVQPGFADAGVLVGHCVGCYARGVHVKHIGFWGIRREQIEHS